MRANSQGTFNLTILPRQWTIPDLSPASSPNAHPMSSNPANSNWRGGPQIEASCPGQNAWANRWKISNTTDGEGLNRSGCRQSDPGCPSPCECPFADSCRSQPASTWELLSNPHTVQDPRFHRSSCFLQQRGRRYPSDPR